MKDKNFGDVPFYAFNDRRKAEYLVQVPAGIWAIRLRAPEIDDSIYLETARQLELLSKRFSFKLAVDFRPGIIQKLDYDFVHLRTDDIEEFRKLRINPDSCFLSAHSEDDVRLALSCGIEHVVLSPVFEPLTAKSFSVAPLGLEEFCRIVKKFPKCRIFALGGISPERIEEVVSASGCFGVAGISLFDALQ